MSLRSVKQYVAEQLVDLSVPTVAGSLSLRVQPLAYDLLSTPVVWLWADTINEKRLGGTRAAYGAGKKDITYQLRITVAWDVDMTTTDPSGFDDLIELVQSTIREIDVENEILTDGITNRTSQLFVIGEQAKTTVPMPAAINETGNPLRYVAHIVTETREFVDG